MNRLLVRLDRFAFRLYARRYGEVRALQEYRSLREVARFSSLLAVLVLIPTSLLAVLALRSIETEEISDIEGLRQRAGSMTEQVNGSLQDIFIRFESTVVQRIQAQERVVDASSDLASPLRLAFRIVDGQLVEPFVFPDPPPDEPTASYRESFRLGQRLEADGELEQAHDAYLRASDAATQSWETAQALLARARLRAASGDRTAARQLLGDISTDYANERGPQGFRFGDLAQLQLGTLLLQEDRVAGAAVLRALVDDLLVSRWTVGRPVEASLAHRTLELLGPNVDTAWHTRSTAALDERTALLHWTTAAAEELAVVEALHDSSRASIQYHAEDGALWATILTRNELYAFAFDYDLLGRELDQSISRVNQFEPDLRAVALRAGDPDPALPFSRRSLAPLLPELEVVVVAAHPAELARRQAGKRLLQVFVILLAVGAAGTGIVVAARTVRRELDTARSRSDFAAVVSHELRSPLTKIRLKAESLQLDLVDDDADRQAHYDAIVREAEHLSRLVDNVLDFASIERGAKRYSLRAEDPATILEAAADSLRDAVEAAGLVLEVDIAPDLPVLWLDREAIGQVLTNLISNAIKYGSDGGWIGVRARMGIDGVDVSVSDRGMGMSPEDQRRAFRDFFRSSNPEVRKRRGTGIGLAIVRYIVEAHGGTIGVESAPGQGTTFTITLALRPPRSAQTVPGA